MALANFDGHRWYGIVSMNHAHGPLCEGHGLMVPEADGSDIRRRLGDIYVVCSWRQLFPPIEIDNGSEVNVYDRKLSSRK